MGTTSSVYVGPGSAYAAFGMWHTACNMQGQSKTLRTVGHIFDTFAVKQTSWANYSETILTFQALF